MPGPIVVTGGPPSSWTQGESVQWTTPAAGFPDSDGWKLSAILRSFGGSPLAVTGVVAPGGYAFSLTSAQTAAMPPGPISWQIFASKDPAGELLLAGSSTVCANLAMVGPDWDPRSFAQQQLDALESLGPSILANGYKALEMAGRAAEFRSLDEYYRALDKARAAVLAEQHGTSPCSSTNPGGAKPKSRLILARFSTP